MHAPPTLRPVMSPGPDNITFHFHHIYSEFLALLSQKLFIKKIASPELGNILCQKIPIHKVLCDAMATAEVSSYCLFSFPPLFGVVGWCEGAG